MPVGTIPPRPDEPYLRDKSPMSWRYSTLDIYCFRNFTFAEDYLPAIAGIAQKVMERTDYTYKAGLWLEVSLLLEVGVPLEYIAKSTPKSTSL